MKRLCVFCGASPGAKAEYSAAAREMGHLIAEKNIELVYGGGGLGLMGQVAKAVVEKNGHVIGVIPQHLMKDELVYKEGIADLRVVKDMLERKALMAELSDGFLTLPGGFGTLDEFFEMISWSQLGIQKKPCGLLNVCNFYDRLLEFLDVLVDQKFVQAEHQDMIVVEQSPQTLLEKMLDYEHPTANKAQWLVKLSS